jgi:hypothetical protein
MCMTHRMTDRKARGEVPSTSQDADVSFVEQTPENIYSRQQLAEAHVVKEFVW